MMGHGFHGFGFCPWLWYPFVIVIEIIVFYIFSCIQICSVIWTGVLYYCKIRKILLYLFYTYQSHDCWEKSCKNKQYFCSVFSCRNNSMGRRWNLGSQTLSCFTAHIKHVKILISRTDKFLVSVFFSKKEKQRASLSKDGRTLNELKLNIVYHNDLFCFVVFVLFCV